MSNNPIILAPQTEIPENEKWVFENPEVLASLKRGLEESAEGKCSRLEDFSKYID